MIYRRNSQNLYSKDQINLDNGLSGLWSGYGSGLLVPDRTMKGQDGAISGGYDWVLGPNNKNHAPLFDGTNGKSVVTLKANPNPFASRSFSICFWIWTISNATKGVIDPGTNGSGGPTFVWLLTGPVIRFDVNTAGNISSTSFQTREWNHFSLTWDNDIKQQTIYKNGVLNAQQTTASAAGTDFNAGGTWNFGSMGTTFYLNAAFGECRFYNRAITSTEALMLANPSFNTARLVDRRATKIIGSGGGGSVVLNNKISNSLRLGI